MSKHPVYHDGELYLQKRSGVEAAADKLSTMMITDRLQEQHKQFYALLNILFVASVDERDRPWASVVTGSPGFISVPDEKHIRVDAQIIAGDILNENVKHNKLSGILGLEHHSRRRNRIAGELITGDSNGLLIEVNQVFGNCPKYIQTRLATITKSRQHTKANEAEEYGEINEACRALINKSNTFFIASYYPGCHSESQHKGADISHRGGQPGFVRIENNDTLVFDDFSGNNLYMTLGNLYSHPYAGLLFIDYNNGDLWQFQCKACIIETPDEKYTRRIKLKVIKIIKLANSLNMIWETL
ncbi:probable iron-sulfur binding protein YPO1417 [hydrothermal vent metagenome]|uniref:Probable iron-sulfur binding protein YPO1417 n=1 Tax=hydrothermal vent metagenome TaxID=652676 RepID=A0A3B0WVX4_9ZZZZ